MANKNELNLRSIGHRIRTERERLALSREKFAELMELSDYYVGQLERGERSMSLPVLVKVSTHLRESIDYLIFGTRKNTDYFKEDSSYYGTANTDINKEINYLLAKCSNKELELITKLIKTVIPYLSPRQQ